MKLYDQTRFGAGGKPPKGTPGVCRECGCTDEEACEGGCSWVEPDLCSSCVDKAKAKDGKGKKPRAKAAPKPKPKGKAKPKTKAKGKKK